MEIIKYIFCLAVLFALIYSAGFCFFYGMAMEDWVFMLLCGFFAGLAYFWNVMFHLKDNGYTHMLIEFLRNIKE